MFLGEGVRRAQLVYGHRSEARKTRAPMDLSYACWWCGGGEPSVFASFLKREKLHRHAAGLKYRLQRKPNMKPIMDPRGLQYGRSVLKNARHTLWWCILVWLHF